MPRVNPAILVWARETAGLTRDEAADALGLRDARGVARADRLAALETGNADPTPAQLQAMAGAYRRPLLTFYMEAPPRPADRGEDFRTLPDAAPPRMEAWTDALLRDVRTRQAVVKGVLMEDDDVHPLPFVGSMGIGDGVPKVAAAIQDKVGISVESLRRQPNPDKVFASLREKVEALGVFVLLLGDLGTHHTAIDTAVFRGFALADPLAPFVVINDKDSRTAWSFTLLHELAHLWIGATGISGGVPAGSPVEVFCNEVAARILLPDEDVRELRRNGLADGPAALPLVIAFAAERKVSPDLVAYRAFRSGLLSRDGWAEVAGALRSRLRALREQEKEQKPKSGGGSYYTTRRHRLGVLVGFVQRSLEEGTLSPTKAALVLGVKPRMVANVVAAS